MKARASGHAAPRRARSSLGLGAGFLLFLGLLFCFHPGADGARIGRMGAVAALMAVWWITEALPLAATSLLPFVLFPLLGIMTSKEIAPLYINSTIFLFLGGFLIALAMERWNLHRRIALKTLLWFGRSPALLVLGFMGACAFLSAWISNTATAVAMLPVGMAVLHGLEERWGRDRTATLAVALMLGIAYACSIGGVATLVGTPPNLALKTIFENTFPEAPKITFAQWSLLGVPLAVTMLIAAWLVLTKLWYPPDPGLRVDRRLLREQYAALGPMAPEEKRVAGVFLTTALLWMFRVKIEIGSVTIPGWSQLFNRPGLIDDGTVAVTMALLLFLLPASGQPGERLLGGPVFARVPWGIILLFGGGFALAEGFKVSGLSDWLGTTLFADVGGFPALGIVFLVCLAMTFLTELTSNTASTQMVLPILAAIALAQSIHPLLLMLPATLSASMAFMMPVATPPNAIVFGSHWLTVRQMARAGLVLNLIGVVLTTATLYLVGVKVFDLGAAELPAWAR
ncbi:MAG: SLC13/DASS family transporter [Verrucomicrobiales bacterium]|nr:SLC13/DASS family transporter [Verrucomicrobiales bacterium]